MEISIIISALVANLLTKHFKPSKLGLLTTELEDRKKAVRLMNAGFGFIALIVTYLFLGEEMDPTELQSYVEILLGGIVTYFGSQGAYFINKDK